MSNYTANGLTMNLDENVDSCNKRIETLEFVIAQLHKKQISSDKIEHFNKMVNSQIRMIKVEKLFYESFLKNSNKRIFPILLSKYDELLNENYEIRQEMVEKYGMQEEEYRLYCEVSLEKRNAMRKICKNKK